MRENSLKTFGIKNTFLRRHEIQKEDNFKIVAKITTKGDTQHFIIKCTSDIRKAIYDEGNYVYTAYGRSNVKDSYHVYQCYKCQGFGHNANDCNGTQKCAKCGEGHRLKDCESGTEKCVNCEKSGKTNVNHRANNWNCPCYSEEEAKVRNNTDHGF